MLIKYIFLDLDGTLLDKNKKIGVNNLKTLTDISTRFDIVLCSGRSPLAMKPYIDSLSLNTGFSISFNGAIIFENNSLETLRSFTLSNKDLLMIFTFILLLNIPVSVDISTSNDVYQITDFAPSKYQTISHNFLNFHKIKIIEIPQKIAIATCIIMGSPSNIEKIKNNITPKLNNLFSITKSRSDMLEFLPSEANKLNAAKNLVSKKGDNLSNIIFFGNDENDITLLKKAGIGVAMGNSSDIVKKNSDMVIGSNNNDSISNLLNLLI